MFYRSAGAAWLFQGVCCACVTSTDQAVNRAVLSARRVCLCVVLPCPVPQYLTPKRTVIDGLRIFDAVNACWTIDMIVPLSAFALVGCASAGRPTAVVIVPLRSSARVRHVAIAPTHATINIHFDADGRRADLP
ncbi:hypothetical protein EVAR_24304_1 [Eumeta japonica]|uniref:Secreted protein n=1 Tax=Eumeta variegata TaxID=151549 RepID=A0A4C1VN47_EUMVA|nr:hypothetical protein EVAR_24304_1 [Eumeta japonica]